MENYPVMETQAAQVKTVTGPGNRRYREISVFAPGFTFRPGQFVMIKKNCGPTCWAYPYMLQRKTENGFTVLAGKDTSLWEAQKGLPLIVWGPSGKAVRGDEKTVVVTEEAAAFLAMPFFNESPEVKYVALCSEKMPGFLKNFPNGVYRKTVQEAASLLEELNGYTVIAALNADKAQELAGMISGFDPKKFMVFASTKINCGVDGCKGCYLHSDSVALGISVCCNGPYLPYEKIDFEANRHCFYTFE